MATYPYLKAYIAGGVAREVIRGCRRGAKDFDFFISGADSDAFLRDLSRFGELSYGPFGSPRWTPSPNKRSIYADVIVIERFNNGLWQCEDMVDALNQFDFTANAIGFDLRSETILNPQNGVRDATRNVMRAVRFDFPDEPIPGAPDLSRLGVLWIRLVHYSNILSMEVEPHTKTWIMGNGRYSDQVSDFARTFFRPELAPNVWLYG